MTVITYGASRLKITYNVFVEDATAFFKRQYPCVTIHKVTGFNRKGDWV